jgi:hypothetical protein
MIEALASNEGKPLTAEAIEDDKNKYAILSSNGMAWEMNGVLQVLFLKTIGSNIQKRLRCVVN